jgi:integrase
MAQFNYYLKTSSIDRETNINLRITSNGKSVFLYTGLKVKRVFWCNDKSSQNYQRVISTRLTRNANEINTELNRLLELARRAESSFGKMKPNPSEIKNKLLSFLNEDNEETLVDNQKMSIYEFWDNHVIETLKRINPRTNNLITSHTSKSLNQTKRVLKRFEKHTRYKIDFETINLDFYRRFVTYCDRVEKFRTNTFGKHIRNIKCILNRAEILGYQVNKEYRISDFQTTTEITTSIYLTESEIQSIIELDLTKTPGLSRTRDLFVIGCYLGLRFGDYSDLNRAEVIDENTIKIKTYKTAKIVTLPILEPIKNTIQKYLDIENKKFIFPKSISNQKFNSQLKDIAKKIPALQSRVHYISHINGREVIESNFKWEKVTSHTCRRSFATNMFLRGIDIFLIMKLTGHQTEKEFYKYIKIDPDDTANKVREQFNNTSR